MNYDNYKSLKSVAKPSV